MKINQALKIISCYSTYNRGSDIQRRSSKYKSATLFVLKMRYNIPYRITIKPSEKNACIQFNVKGEYFIMDIPKKLCTKPFLFKKFMPYKEDKPPVFTDQEYEKAITYLKRFLDKKGQGISYLPKKERKVLRDELLISDLLQKNYKKYLEKKNANCNN